MKISKCIISVDITVFNIPHVGDVFEFKLWCHSELGPNKTRVSPTSSVANCWVLSIGPNYLQNRCVEAEQPVQ